MTASKRAVKNSLPISWVNTEKAESFEYLGEIDFIFQTNFGNESGNQVDTFHEEKQSSKISCICTFQECFTE
jgi:hypothetical protein